MNVVQEYQRTRNSRTMEVNRMSKLIDFQCLCCGTVIEGFDDDELYCEGCAIVEPIDYTEGIIPTKFSKKMQPIFSPKNNGQRWRHRDK